MKNKVVILQATISSYNIPVFKLISEYVDLTIAYTHTNENIENISINIVKLNYVKIFNIIFIKNRFYKFCSQFDIVIFLADLHNLSYCSLPFRNRQFKVIPWTIGIRASYKRRYDVTRKKDFIDHVYNSVLRRSDAILFYMKIPIEFWADSLDYNKVFIAINTVDVLEINRYKDNIKNSLLFIGTLYKEKKIYELLNAYIKAKREVNSSNFLKLEIIGVGNEFEALKYIIDSSGLSDSIILRGAIYDEKEIMHYFEKAILCISPDQAGLSVLKSMGYGVPFVTRSNAITGGERFNISNNENGLFYCTESELSVIIKDAYNNPERYLTMGQKALEYYRSNATIKHMAQGFLDAIKYVA